MFRVRLVGSFPPEYTGGLFTTGHDASNFAARLNIAARANQSPTRFKVEKIESKDSDSWRLRETARFLQGEYERVPWHNEPWFKDSEISKDHFTHLSAKNPGSLAYTESVEKGIADRQTPIKPGRYLTQFFSELVPHTEICQWAAEVSKLGNVEGFKIARTADDIERVYRNGPNSCMSHGLSHFDSCHHPVRVYGDSDISLAYLERDSSIPARCLIWEDKKICSTIYGDGGVYQRELERLLDESGYEEGSFSGAKIQRIESSGGYILPYFDNDSGVDYFNEKLFVISENLAEYEAKNTNGLSVDLIYCIECEVSLREDDCYHSDNGNGPYCDSCYCGIYTRCESCDFEILADESQYIDCKTLCDSCVSNEYSICEDCNDPCNNDDIVILNPDNEHVCPDCFEKNHHICEDCGDPYHADSCAPDIEGNDDILCKDCLDTRESDREDEKQLKLDFEAKNLYSHIPAIWLEYARKHF